MLTKIKRFFQDQVMSDLQADQETRHEHAIQLATAALLVEMSRADYSVREEERQAVREAVSQAFQLQESETRKLVELAEEEARQATSLFQFTQLIDKHFSNADKIRVVEMLWQVALADRKIDKYEEHLVRKLADLLHVSHRDYIRAKHKVLGAVSKQK